MITQTELKQLLSYESSTGLFRWLVERRGTNGIGSEAGTPRSDGRIQIGIDGKYYLAHRLAWLYMTGEWPDKEIDHKNLKADDNRWCNLRESTRSQNASNKRLQSNNTSGYKGVSWWNRDQKWRARLWTDRKLVYSSFHNTAEEAYEAYCKAAKEYHKEFARVS